MNLTTTSPASYSSLLAAAVGTAGIVFVCRKHFYRSQKRRPKRGDEGTFPTDYQDPVTSIEELRQVIPAGMSGSTVENASKVLSELDDQMKEFIKRSPMVFIATADASGLPFVSPKGDAPGFVQINERGQLLIPDRPGNRLVFGWQNLIESNNPTVGLLFQIPGNETTLRISGRAQLYRDEALCHQLAARGLDAKLVLVVQVEYAFFHCSKAYIRSELWKPESWPKEPFKVAFGKYFSSASTIQKQVDNYVDRGYDMVRQSVQGSCAEPS